MSGRRWLARILATALVAAALVVPVAAPPPVAADPPPASGVVDITVGNVQACALRANGSVKCWGVSDAGQLGLGTTATRGDGPGEMGANLPSVDLGNGRTATAVDAGASFTCALLDNGAVKCWGINNNGQLGLGDMVARGDGAGEMGDSLPSVDLGTGRTAIRISVGSLHACAILDNSAVKCWGFNAGALGLGDMAARGDGPGEMGDSLPAVNLGTGRTATAISAGDWLTCAILDNAAVKCWGRNDAGQLGLGDTAWRGQDPGGMGDNLPAVDLGTGRTATSIAVGLGAGGGHANTCATLDNGAVKCWGGNHLGQLGLGDVVARGDGPGEMGDSLPAVDLGPGRTATSVVSSGGGTCARLDDGSVKCWGQNNYGQLGLGNMGVRGDGPGEMGANLPPVDLGAGRTAVAISAGPYHTCALLEDTAVKCWGQGGLLGLGGGGTRGDGSGEMGDNLPVVVLDASPTVSVAADESSVAAGGSIHVHVTVTNPGDQALTGVTVDGGNATGCDTVIASLAAGAQQIVDCTHVTTGMDLPSFTATASVTTTQTPAAVSSTQLTVPVTLSPSIGAISGTVRRAVTLAPIAGGFVALLSPADFSVVGFANARANGTFSTVAAPGNYFVYALDPAGAHLPGFVGAPTQVTVTGGATATVNPLLSPAAGGFSGTVTETGPNAPIDNVLVVSLDTATGQGGAGAVTDGAGAYTVSPLPAGSRYGIFVDLGGAHVTEFYNDSPDISGADAIAVGGGTTTGVDASLASSTPPGGGAILQGAVTDSVTNGGLSGVAVIVLRAGDYSLVGGTITGSGGTYNLDVEPGAYKLAFYSLAASHFMEWHDDQPSSGLGAAASVTAIAGTPTTVDAEVDPANGTAAGTVTEDGTGDPLANVWVVAVGPTGIIRVTTTDIAGAYTIGGLAPGGYRLRFVDSTDDHLSEWHQDVTSPDAATPVAVVGGQTTTTNAALEAIP